MSGRSVGSAVLLALIPVLIGCGGGDAPLEEPDFVVAPEALASEVVADRDRAFAKYDGRIVRLTGNVREKVEPGGGTATRGVAFASIGERLAVASGLAFVRFASEGVEDFERIEVGRTITVQCRFERLDEGRSFEIGSCRLVD